MNKEPLAFMQFILHTYRDGILDSLESGNGLAGEYFGQYNEASEARLLCQTRTIYFLVKYHELFDNDQALSSALHLYQNTRTHYLGMSGWKGLPGADKETLDLYELAFICYAFSYLYRATGDEYVAKDAKHVFAYLIALIEREDFFPELVKYNGLPSQNPLMHLYESFVSGFDIFNQTKYKSTASVLLALVERHFFDKKTGRIHEVVSGDNSSDWSEPGHAFEWVSLLAEASKYEVPNNSKITTTRLLTVAEEGVTNDGFVRSRFESDPEEPQNSYRIWPQLERARAFYETGATDKGAQALEHVLHHFFDNNGHPIEYLGFADTMQSVKTTTGYHIVNCFNTVLGQLNRT